MVTASLKSEERLEVGLPGGGGRPPMSLYEYVAVVAMSGKRSQVALMEAPDGDGPAPCLELGAIHTKTRNGRDIATLSHDTFTKRLV